MGIEIVTAKGDGMIEGLTLLVLCIVSAGVAAGMVSACIRMMGGD